MAAVLETRVLAQDRFENLHAGDFHGATAPTSAHFCLSVFNKPTRYRSASKEWIDTSQLKTLA